MSAGNSGSWVENAKHGSSYLYASDVSMQTDGVPGSYTNSLAVASIDNAGSTGEYLSVGEHAVFYTQSYEYMNEPFTTIPGEQRYIFIDGFGTEAEWAAVGDALKGAIAVCSVAPSPSSRRVITPFRLAPSPRLSIITRLAPSTWT